MAELIEAHQSRLALGESRENFYDVVAHRPHAKAQSEPDDRAAHANEKSLETKTRRDLPRLGSQGAKQPDLARSFAPRR